MKRIVRALAGAAVLGAVVLVPTTSSAAPASQSAQRYIVVLHDGVDPDRAANDHARSEGARVELIYRYALNGYAATMSPAAAARIAGDRRVDYVESDQIVQAFDHEEVPTGVDRVAVPATKHVVGAHLTIDGNDDKRVDVDVAIIDTGIDHTHTDLNVVAGTDCTGGGPFNSSCKNGLAGDGNGHGTHVAGTVAAKDNGQGVVGLAPGARLHAVKVLRNDGSGYLSWITAGIDWVTARGGKNGPISVANMSLGCECTSSAMDTAIRNSVAAGVVYAVAAGNSAKDASTFSPANHPDVITVSALADFDGKSGGGAAPTCRSDVDDTLANFSNYGSSVELAAPGVCIRSTWPGGGANTISGTSMASPHVAGAAALLTSQTKPTTKTAADSVRSTLMSEGNLDWNKESGKGAKEKLLDVSDATTFTPKTVAGSGGGGTPTNTAPTAHDVAVTAAAGESVEITLRGSDAEQCDLAFSVVAGPSQGTLGSLTNQACVDTTSPKSDTATVTYTASASASGGDSFSYKVNDGATDSNTATVTVTITAAAGDFTLTASGYKVKGVQHADLSWSGASSTGVDIKRDGEIIATEPNSGAYTDNLNRKGGGSATYQVCEAGTSTCSNTATVSF